MFYKGDKMRRKLENLKKEILEEFNRVISFWMENVIDYKNRDFIGKIKADGTKEMQSEKSLILATRILWTFSKCYQRFKENKYLETADILYEYIKNNFVDKEYGGLYWMLDYNGNVIDSTKKFYGQSFGIYSFVEYAKASGNKQAVADAYEIFDIIEKYGKDKENGGYIESASRDFSFIKDMRLSERDMNAPKSMNTHLHILEAYSNLANFTKDEKVIKVLEEIIEIFLDKIMQKNGHSGLFFDMKWNLLSDLISYGHDIETSWLLKEAVENSNDKDLKEKVILSSINLAEVSTKEAIDKKGGILYEGASKGPFKTKKEWWMQVEAMVGYMNAYQMTDKEIYIDKLLNIWKFCKEKFRTPYGEWYYFVDEKNEPVKEREIAGPWKCPYHSIRAFLEIMERIEKVFI